MYFQGKGNRERAVICLHGSFTVGAVGAPTLDKVNGIQTVVRTAAGKYDLTLLENYPELLMVKCILKVAGVEDITFQLTASDVANGTLSIGAKTGGVFTEISNGAQVFIEVTVKDTSVAY